MNAKRIPTFRIIALSAAGWALGCAVGYQMTRPRSASHGSARVSKAPAPPSIAAPSNLAPEDGQGGPRRGRGMAADLAKVFDLPDELSRRKALIEAVRKMSLEEIPNAIAEAGKLPAWQMGILVPTLAAYWAENDPHGALAYCASGSISDGVIANAVLGVWIENDAPAAQASVLALPSTPARGDIVVALTALLAARDPTDAVRFFNEAPVDPISENDLQLICSAIFGHWAHLSTAADAALDLSHKDLSEKAVPFAVERWAKTEPAAAVAWCQNIADPALRQSALQAAIAAWATINPAAGSAYLLQMPAGEQRDQAIKEAVKTMAATNLQAALGLLDKLPAGECRNIAACELAFKWADADPKAAATYLQGVPPSEERNNTLSRIADAWAKNDPRGAAASIQECTDPASRQILAAAVADEWAESDPKAAAAFWLKNVPETHINHTRMPEILAVKWAKNAPQEALDWTKRLPEGEARLQAMAAILETVADTEPQKALILFAQLPEAARTEAVFKITRAWVDSDVQAAAQWVSRLPEGEGRARGVAMVASTWADADQDQAAAWVKSLPNGPSRDEAVDTFSRHLRDPESAAAWAATISALDQRSLRIKEIASEWMGLDPQAARRWINATKLLSNEDKTALIK